MPPWNATQAAIRPASHQARDGAKRTGCRVISVLVVEDQFEWADSVRYEVGVQKGMTAVGAARTVAEAVAVCELQRGDIAVVDLLLGSESGLDFLRTASQRFPAVAVVMMSARPTVWAVQEARACGAAGFIHKRDLESAEGITRVVTRVANGERVFTPGVADGLGQSLAQAYGLTQKQREILRCLRQGMEVDEIAARLHLGRQTVRNYVSAIGRAVGVPGGQVPVLAWYVDQLESGRFPDEAP